MLDIADNQVSQPLLVNGEPVEIDGKIIETRDGPAVQHAKLRVDTRKWAASKLKPKKYGDRLENVHSGSIGLKDLTDAQLDARLNSISAKSEED